MLRSFGRCLARLLIVLTATLTMHHSAQAVIVFTISAVSDSATEVTLTASGTGTLTSTSGEWSFVGAPFGNIPGDPFPGALVTDFAEPISSGTLTASKGVLTTTLTRFGLDDDGGGPNVDDLFLTFNSNPSFLVNDTITFSGSATRTLAGGATFGDLTKGTYDLSSAGELNLWASNFARSDFTNGLVIAAVPEPAEYGFLFGGAAILFVAFRRSTRRQLA
ncbi:hypothetical protein N8633_00400 [bacterium]|nr:hypothetical protein [bacterium]